MRSRYCRPAIFSLRWISRDSSRAEALADAIRFALEFDTKVIVEASVSGREIELAVLDGKPPAVSLAGEIIVEHPDGFYSYDAKYIDEHGARLDLPASISADQLARAQALALRAFEVLECDGMARVDLFLTREGRLLVNEINTIPGSLPSRCIPSSGQSREFRPLNWSRVSST